MPGYCHLVIRDIIIWCLANFFDCLNYTVQNNHKTLDFVPRLSKSGLLGGTYKIPNILSLLKP